MDARLVLKLALIAIKFREYLALTQKKILATAKIFFVISPLDPK